MKVEKYVSNPVVIEAIQFIPGNMYKAVDWCDCLECVPGVSEFDEDKWYVKTLEGDMWINEGDWLIKGILGEFYPCKDEVFKQKYRIGHNDL